MRQSPRRRRSKAAAEADPASSGDARANDYRLEDQVGFRLRKVHQRATDVFTKVMAGFDITPMQFAALARLDDLGTVSQNQLGRLVAMDPATIFGVVGRLLRRGLVETRLDARDGRLVLVALTPAGRRLTRQMKAQGAEVSRRILAPLAPCEQAALLAMLERLE